MSVRQKRPDTRTIYSVLIAVLGYVSVTVSFISMFSFDFDAPRFFAFMAVFSVLYIALSLGGSVGSFLVTLSLIAFVVFGYRNIDMISAGYKFIYNTIYSAAYNTDISYFKFLNEEDMVRAETMFFFGAEWIVAVGVYFFTIHFRNPVLPLITTFPIIEVGLYNGIKLPVLPGICVVAYWLAQCALCNIDMGEYSGGTGGFVRREDSFFPKRHMRLKVTEQCGLLVIVTVLTAAGLTAAVMKLTGYKRSEELNRKRIEVRDAVSSFSVTDLANSISDITEAFGFSFRIENHKLGNVERLKYKGSTDLIVTFDRKYEEGAVYLKEYTGSVYGRNEWLDLTADKYNDEIFGEFEKYGVYPQDMPYIMSRWSGLYPQSYTDHMISIECELKGERSFAPYAVSDVGGLTYNNDTDVSSMLSMPDSPMMYRFLPSDAELLSEQLTSIARSVYSVSSIEDPEWRDRIMKYCEENQLLTYDNYFSADTFTVPQSALYSSDVYYHPEYLMALLIESEYRDFVYENYLDVPKGSDMDEVRAMFADIIDSAGENMTAQEKIDILIRIRERMSSNVTYSLIPGKTPGNRDFVNYFLLENKKGYCTHYATSGVLLARMAGIPARYATGYVIVGDDFKTAKKFSSGSYTINVQDNKSHAWAEIYLDGFGWVPFEFTAGYSPQSIDTTPTTTAATTTGFDTETTTADSTDTGQTTSRRTSGKGNGTRAATTTSTVTTTSPSGRGGGGSRHSDGSSGLPQTVKDIAAGVVIIAAAAAVIWLRRRIILWLRRKHFTEGSLRKRAAYIYGYTESLLGLDKKDSPHMTLDEIAVSCERKMAGRYFEPGQFRGIVSCAERAAFAEGPPEENEVRSCMAAAESMAQRLYSDKSGVGQLLMKYIRVLI